MYYYIGIIAILSILIGFAAVNDPASLQGISMAVFWGTILAIALWQAKKREVDGNWLVRIMLIGLFVRFGMAFVHLAVGLWFYEGKIDFTGYHESGITVGQNLLQGQLVFPMAFDLGTRVAKFLPVMFYFMAVQELLECFSLWDRRIFRKLFFPPSI